MKYKNGYKSEQYLIFEVPYDTTVVLVLNFPPLAYIGCAGLF